MQTIVINVCNACVNRCLSCFSYNENKFMSVLNFKKIINKIPGDLNNIIISGGEPMMHKNLPEMLKYAAENKIKPNLLTSGAIDYDLNDIKDSLNMLFITLKFPSELDSTFKKNTQAFKNANKLLAQAKALKIKTAINWSVDTQNYPYMKKMVEIAKKYNAELRLLRFMPFSIAYNVLFLNKDLWSKVCEDAINYGKRIGVDVGIDFPSKYSYLSCIAGINRANILVDGSVTPCIYDSKNVIGNIFIQSWQNIEKSLELWRLNYKNVKGCLVLKDCLKGGG